MTKRIACFIACLMMITSVCMAQAEYEMSSYVLYVTVQPDGSAKIREEIILSLSGAYESIDRKVNLTGIDGAHDFSAWADGELLTESTDAQPESGTFSVAENEEGAVVSIYSPGENDWRVFACAYTLDGFAQRYKDSGVIERELIPPGHDVLYQNATIIVTLPEANGEILAYADGALSSENALVQYDRVSLGPVDVAVDSFISVKLLFPQEWLSEAQTIDENVREDIITLEETQAEERRQGRQAVKLGKYIALGVYTALFGGLFLWAFKKYGVVHKKMAEADETLLDRYPAALTAYVYEGVADTDALVGTLSELKQSGHLNIRAGEQKADDIVLELISRPEELQAHQKAAAQWLFGKSNTIRLSDLEAKGDYDRAQQIEKAYTAYCAAVADDAWRAGLRWKNEEKLIVISSLEIFSGIILMIIMLLLDEALIFTAGITTVVMFFLMKQFERIRHLTDDGERLKAAAVSFGGMSEKMEQEMLSRLPVTAGLNKLETVKGDEAQTLRKLAASLRAAHVRNASLRRSKRAN